MKRNYEQIVEEAKKKMSCTGMIVAQLGTLFVLEDLTKEIKKVNGR